MSTVTLEESYRACQQLSRRHGTTYYLSTFVLPSIKRHHVWALYGFCRRADDIVDDTAAVSTEDRRAALAELGNGLRRALGSGHSDDPVLHAVAHTARAFDIAGECFERFLSSMSMDLTVSRYATWEDLLGYMDGSAAVIGEMMLPILESRSSDALGPARDLGFAFQLTNFLRDVAEDLDRGRIYIPETDLARFDARPARRAVDDSWRDVMRFEIDRCRALYASADTGIDLLAPASARCVRAARVLYGEILDRIEAADYDVFSRRARVPTARKVGVAALAMLGLQRGGRRC